MPLDGGQDLHRLGDVAADNGDPDTEPGRELGACVSSPQVGQHQQCLPVHGAPAPPRAPFQAPGGRQAGQTPQGRAGQIDPRWVDKHVKLRADRLLLVDNPSTRSFTSSRTPLRQPAGQSAKLETAQSLKLRR